MDLVELDDKHRVHWDEGAKNVREQMLNIFRDIAEGVGKIEPQLRGKIHATGSSFGECKIGAPDEFDFVIEIGLDVLSSGLLEWCPADHSQDDILLRYTDLGRCEVAHDHHICMDIQDDSDSDCSCDESSDPAGFIKDLDRDGAFALFEILHSQAIKERASDALREVLISFDLPEQPGGITHAGIRTKLYPGEFSGFHKHSAGFFFQFKYISSGETNSIQNDLNITADLTFTLKAPLSSIPIPQGGSIMDFTLLDDDVKLYAARHPEICDYVWCLLKNSPGVNLTLTCFENNFMAQFQELSVPKRAIRLSKIIAKRCCQVKYEDLTFISSEVESWMTSVDDPMVIFDKVKDDKDRFCEVHNLLVLHDMKFQDTPERTFKYWGENLGGISIFPSYVFTKIVLYLLIMNEEQSRSWEIEHLPLIICKIFSIIHSRIEKKRSKDDDFMYYFVQNLQKQLIFSYDFMHATIAEISQEIRSLCKYELFANDPADKYSCYFCTNDFLSKNT